MPQNYVEGSEPIPGYRLVSFLGEGGFGKVWKATAPGGAEVALKIIRLGGTQGRKEFRSLQRVKRIRHPNLIPVTAFWLKNDDGGILDDALTEQESLPTEEEAEASDVAATLAAPTPSSADRPAELIIAMGLGDESLFARLGECRAEGLEGIPAEELLGYMEHAAEGLDFLNRPIHQLGAGDAAIQHCDIKPHNLLIVGGAVQICDFGLARVMGAAQTTTDSASTIAYVAPEFLKDGEPSTATDQYSLAITYFELRTGELPYSSNSFVGVANAVMEGALELAKLPRAEQEVIRKATSPDPSARFKTVADMVRALRGAVEGTPVAASVATAGRAAGCGCGSFLAAAVIGVMLLAIAFFAARRYAPDQLARLLAWQEWVVVDEPVIDEPVIDEPVIDEPVIDEPIVEPIPVEETIDAFCDRMALLIDSGQEESCNEAIQSVQEAIGRGEQDGRLWRLLGLAHLGLQQAEQAVLDFTQAHAKTMDQVDLVHRGEAYYELGSFDEALADFNPAIDHFEAELSGAADDVRQPYAAAYLGRGTILFMQGEVEAALADLETGRAYDPEDFRFFSRLGSFHLHIKTPKDCRIAVDYFAQAIALEPSDVDYVNQGRAYSKLEDFENALAAFDAALQHNPRNADAYYLAGDCYLRQSEKQYGLAIARFTPAIELYEDYKQAIVGDPLFKLSSAYYFRATCYIQIGPLDEAAGDLTLLLEQPDDLSDDVLIAIIESLADAMAEAGRYEEAIEWIKRAIEQAPEANRQQYREKLQRYEAEQTETED